MQRQLIAELIASKEDISHEHLETLEQVVVRYPYFQTARLLRLLGLKNTESYTYNQELRKTAAHSGDRSVLFDLITKVERMKEEVKIIHQPVALSDESTEKANSAKDLYQAPDELPIGTPLAFDKEDKHSFNEWLQLSSTHTIARNSKPSMSVVDKPGASTQEDSSQDGPTSNFDLVERFIQNNPKIKPQKHEVSSGGNIALSSVQESDKLMTETLAMVYIEQRKFDKAIKAYKILGLKYPEKSGFFADRIRAVKKLANQ